MCSGFSLTYTLSNLFTCHIKLNILVYNQLVIQLFWLRKEDLVRLTQVMADLGVGPPAITTSIGSCKMRPTSVSEFKVWHMKRVMVEEIHFEVIKMLTNFYFLRHVSANRNLTFRNKILSRLFTSNKLPNSSLQ